MGYAPVVPSELVVNEPSWRQYREWLMDEGKSKAVVIGRPGIGKETSIRLVNRIHNYKEIHVDGLCSKEEIQEIVKTIEESTRIKDIRGRSRVFIFRDIDRGWFNRVISIKNKFVKIVVIDDNGFLSRKTEDSKYESIKMYSDPDKTHRRIESICRKMGVVLPDGISRRIREGEKIGRSILDVEVFARNRLMKGEYSFGVEGVSCIDAVDRILHRRKDVRRTYPEIERICEQAGVQTVQDLLFSNYLGKCLSVEDASVLSEYSSRYDVIGSRGWAGSEVKCVAPYQFHSILYNTIFVSFKPVIKMIAPEKKRSIYKRRYLKREEEESLKEIVSVLVKRVKRASSPEQMDEYTKRSIGSILEGVRDSGIIEEDDMVIMQSIELSTEAGKIKSPPRYIYKNGHSHYVTRDITLQEILG